MWLCANYCPNQMRPTSCCLSALAISELLLLALMKHEILPEKEVAAILEDAADTLKKMPGDNKTPELQAVMARLANSLAAGGNS